MIYSSTIWAFLSLLIVIYHIQLEGVSSTGRVHFHSDIAEDEEGKKEFEAAIFEAVRSGCVIPSTCMADRRRLTMMQQEEAEAEEEEEEYDGSGSGSDEFDETPKSTDNETPTPKPTEEPWNPNDPDDQCRASPQNWNRCDQNIHCLKDKEWDRHWCNDENTFVPCIDCIKEGEICHQAKECSDLLFRCDALTSSQQEALPSTHPCIEPSCAIKRTSKECERAVFDHCCNPELETCQRTERSSCSARGCSQFFNEYVHREIDYNNAKCPFADAAATCDYEHCKRQDVFRDLVDNFGEIQTHRCHGEWCFSQQIKKSCAAAISQRRLTQFKFNQPVILDTTLDGTIKSVITNPLTRRSLEEDNNGVECASANCPTEYENCYTNNQDCRYVIENCMDDGLEKPADCDQKHENVKTELEPLINCYQEKCDEGRRCAQEKCLTEYENCMGDSDCQYTIENCMDDNGSEKPSDCATREETAQALLTPLIDCHGKNCNNDPEYQCLQENCKEKLDECSNHFDCQYSIENCMDDQNPNQPEDCPSKLENAKDILDPLRQCHGEHCNQQHGGQQPHDDGGSDWDSIRETVKKCFEGECADEHETCQSDTGCKQNLDDLYLCGDAECGAEILAQSKNEKFQQGAKCVQEKCFGGSGGNGGNGGGDSRNMCAARISEYCTANPTDKACQEKCPFQCSGGDDCPCVSTACLQVYQAPLCIRESGVCAEFKAELLKEYFKQGFYQPKSEWERKQKEMFLFPRPTGPFEWKSNLTALKDECNNAMASLGDNIASCTAPSIEYCNNREWDQGCQSGLSTCGDGFVTWSERCDDGNYKNDDGCPQWCNPDHGYICPAQGEPCEKCLRDQRAEYQPEICQFCLNDRVELKSPCLHEKCKSVEGYQDAKACDDYVEAYCDQVQASGLRDIGCDRYEKQTTLYNVPIIPNKCEYKIKSVNLNGKTLKKAKIAVFTCEFADQYNVTVDTTPWFKPTHPYFNMGDKEKQSLDPLVIDVLDSILRDEELIPLSELKISDFYEYFDPSLVTEHGGPFHFGNDIARLEVVLDDENDKIPERYNSDGHPNCHHYTNTHRLVPLPPTRESLKWGVKALMMYLKWEAVNNQHDDRFEEFQEFDPSSIDTDDENVGNSTIVFGAILSRTYKYGDEKEREEKEYICSNYNNVWWQDIESNPNCTSVEQNIRDEKARIFFQQNLFQSGCENDDCKLQVEHCRRVGIVPERLHVNADEYEATSIQVIEAVSQMDDAASWTDLVESFVTVSAAAATRAFDDAMELFNRLVIKGKKTKYMKDVPNYCEHQYKSPEWTADPCCNWELRHYKCCAPKDVPNGQIDVVKDVNVSQISTYCPNSTVQVENLLQDLLVNLDKAVTCSEELEAHVSVSSWDEMWKVRDTCQKKIYEAGDKECEKDTDCDHCTLSQCRIDDGGAKGKCTVPWDNIQTCMLQCFSAEMDQELIRYLKDDWNISATAPQSEFADTFNLQMTEPACAGPRAWEQDIGRNGYVYECNTTCTAQHICHDWDYKNYIQQLANKDGHHKWINFQDKDVCQEHGGEMKCQYYNSNNECGYSECRFDNITGPCEAESDCYKTCGKVHQQIGCEEEGGTWLATTHGGRCCPPDAHVYYSQRKGENICSYVPEGLPSGHDLNNLACCSAEGGSWFVQDGHGQCCLGRWKTQKYNNQEYTYCQEEIWGWDRSDCYNTCAAFREDCTDCRKAREGCCGQVYKSANQTACLSYKQCTQSNLQEHECNDPTPFCARCWGNWCYQQGQSPKCYYADRWDASNCATAGGTWDQKLWRCIVPGSDTGDAWDCFQAGPSICPDPYNFTSSYQAGEEVPKYPWRNKRCRRGCYLPDVAKEDCTSWPKYWEASYGNGTGVCQVAHHMANTETKCTDDYNGTYVPETVAYDPGRFSTEEECNEGQCRGSLGWDGWSREQCESSSKYSCSQSCQQCQTWTYPYRDQNSGACFSSNTTTCAGASVPCVVSDETEETCTAENELQVEWISCGGNYDSEEQCKAETDVYAEKLGCSWTWTDCPTQESCEERGYCDDWDNQRQECKDAGWTHGDQCYAHYEEERVDEETNTTISEYKSASCNECQWLDGVCVEPRPNTGCEYGKWHRLGCKVFGKYDKTSCEQVTDAIWYNRATTKEECHAAKGCDEPGRWGLTGLPESECTLCGGEMKPMFEWHGGVWSKPWVDDLVWKPNGAVMEPVNQWKPAIADWRVKKQLTSPIVKRFAKRKQTQALLMYNVFSEALKSLACACGEGNNTDCFSANNGSLSGVSQAFCELEQPINAACGNVVVSKDCPSADTRRRRLSQGQDMGEKATFEWKHYKAGTVSGCLEPYHSGDDRRLLNPLALTNANNVVIGQLLGDGKGFQVTGEFNYVDMCLPIRSDIRDWEFTTTDIATQDVDGKITPSYRTDWSLINGEVCFKATEEGIYYPVKRVDKTAVEIENLPSTVACEPEKSFNVYDEATGQDKCICRCGYSGDTCNSGCLNYCSDKGTCSDGICTCESSRTGADCGEINCPLGKEKKRCSGNGLCRQDAVCVCNDNYKGNDCSEPVYADPQVEKNRNAPKGFGEPQISNPTERPTNSPQPRDRPRPKDEPPLPPQSRCVDEKCRSHLDKCMNAFDSCACYPGLLKCVSRLCPDEIQKATEECTTIANDPSASCTMVCEARPFPTANAAKIEYAVKVEVELRGVSIQQFEQTLQEPFRQAVADSTPGVFKEDVKINEIRQATNSRRRLTTDDALLIDFEIRMSSREQQEQVQQVMKDEKQKTESGNGAQSQFVQALQNQGVITDPEQLQVKETKTVVTVVSADDEGDFEDDDSKGDFFAENKMLILGGGGALLIVMLLSCLCCRSSKSKRSLKVSS